jgi:hypothetical protein
MFSATFSSFSQNVNASKTSNASNLKKVVDKVPRTPEHIAYFAENLGHLIVKPQTVVRDHNDYYVAKDNLSNTWYMCLRHVMMIDIDLKHHDDAVSALQPLRSSNLLFELYKTHNGYHAFCVSQPFDYTDTSAHKIMFDLGCDYFYIVWVSLRGWSVRLNFKSGEFMERLQNKDETWLAEPLYTYLGAIGNTDVLVDAKLDRLVKKHVKYAEKYADYPVAQSYKITTRENN